jgi:hypothetical protein
VALARSYRPVCSLTRGSGKGLGSRLADTQGVQAKARTDSTLSFTSVTGNIRRILGSALTLCGYRYNSMGAGSSSVPSSESEELKCLRCENCSEDYTKCACWIIVQSRIPTCRNVSRRIEDSFHWLLDGYYWRGREQSPNREWKIGWFSSGSLRIWCAVSQHCAHFVSNSLTI